MKRETIFKAEDLFDSLEREKEQEIRKIKVYKDKDLETLCKNYEKWLEFPDHLAYNVNNLYSRAKKLKQKPTSKEITNLSILLSKYQDHKYFNHSGIFISYLINESEEENFSIITTGLEKLLNYIGLYDRKDIVIYGDAGYGVGCGMKNGKIHVDGNAGNWVGDRMKSGEIHIKGDAGGGVGLGMQNGKIHIKGDKVGCEMKNGKIHVEGDIEGLSDYISGGNIYHKGKLIVENGSLIK